MKIKSAQINFRRYYMYMQVCVYAYTHLCKEDIILMHSVDA